MGYLISVRFVLNDGGYLDILYTVLSLSRLPVLQMNSYMEKGVLSSLFQIIRPSLRSVQLGVQAVAVALQQKYKMHNSTRDLEHFNS